MAAIMPNQNIGLDFSTNKSIISYLTPNGELKAFEYSRTDGQPYIPALITDNEGQITGLVVSVPEIWQRGIYDLECDRLHKLAQELGLPLLSLVSKPVAAAAYYSWEMQKHAEPFQGNLLLCDIGRETFDISLCRVYGENKVEVLYFDDQSDQDLKLAGVAFDRGIVQQAYANKYGQPINIDSPEFTRLLKEFEAVKIETHIGVTKRLTVFLMDEDSMADEVAYVFDGYTVTSGEVSKAFDPIAQGIYKAIQRVQNYADQNSIKINRLFLVGGFCQFILVQKKIMDSLEIADKNDIRIKHNFTIVNKVYAISCGACLIANSLIDPVEKYIHTLGIFATKLTVQLEEKLEEITLIKGGTPLNELKQSQFAKDFFVVMDIEDSPTSIDIWIDSPSQGRRIKKSLSNLVKFKDYLFGEQYRVGMKVDSNIAYLVIEDILKTKQEEYPLCNLLT